jgi:asparagine synthase (glutamine-hydrolysing)
MSGIAGLWNLDGAPVDRAVLSAMSRTLRHRGPDGEHSATVGTAGFAVQHSWIRAEEIGEKQPLIGVQRGTMIAFDGRLDNRDALLDALELDRTISDGRIVLAAYDAWGDHCAGRLLGDFAFAVFDERQRRLLLVRDAIGIRPLYYRHGPRLLAFASEIKAILAHPDVAVRPDEDGIADLMMLGTRPLDRQDVTCFAGISALPPAHAAIVTPDRMTVRRYWDFDTARALRLTFDETVEAFREYFFTAVKRRLRSLRPVAISVSGGLDSSSIFCTADRLVRAGAAPCPSIRGISYLGAEGTAADERRFIEAIERHTGSPIEQFPIHPHAVMHSTARDQVHAIEVPFLDTMWGLTCELHRRTTGAGSRVLLLGLWGDQVLFSPAYLADLASRFRWTGIRRHTREYLRHFGPQETRVLTRRIAFDFVRQFVPRPLVGPMKRARLAVAGRRRRKPWFSDEFLARALRFEAQPATIGAGFHSAYARAIYLETRSKYHVHCMEWNNKSAARNGVEVAFPCLDRDLLELLMAVPGEIQNRGGVPRAQLREAMNGILPDVVRNRAGKGDFTAVANSAVAKAAPLITTGLTPTSLAVRFGYLDPERLPAEVARVTEYLEGPDCVNSWDIADLLGLELWFQVFCAGLSGSARHAEEEARPA